MAVVPIRQRDEFLWKINELLDFFLFFLGEQIVELVDINSVFCFIPSLPVFEVAEATDNTTDVSAVIIADPTFEDILL
jgi:hypothetical protein